jgi:hypothetical protein
MDKLRQIALEAYDRFIGLRLADVAVDCCITKTPCGGEMAGRSPVDRGKRGIKRSTAVDADGVIIVVRRLIRRGAGPTIAGRADLTADRSLLAAALRLPSSMASRMRWNAACVLVSELGGSCAI